MSYQVLARKWRPRNFATLVGQEHVVRALTHALSENRLHHAYLFTGTRGVGKTTIARILAKSLNCETGVTATPCGACSACVEIDSGRFVDLLEVDAATNTRVDEMRQLLENAVYAPTRGRYKVYVIDEVHMLSNSAFNAMLKTLEEPPEHVKFILATTDPQKIPVTVLSRCLQFNLKQMPQPAIVGHLTQILAAEQILAEVPALQLIARSAGGSMRDALSLLDQAIAHGAGTVQFDAVRDMLGTVDTDHLLDILTFLIQGNVVEMMNVADLMCVRSISFGTALQELARLLTQLQLAQFVPATFAGEGQEEVRLRQIAQDISPEFVQLAYQIVTQGRDELAIAPDEQAGFVMTLLRLHAFRPTVAVVRAAESVMQPSKGSQVSSAVVARTVVIEAPSPVRSEPDGRNSLGTGDWHQTVAELKLNGMARELAHHCELREFTATQCFLRLPPVHRHLQMKPAQDKLQQALSELLGRPLSLRIEVADVVSDTPAVAVRRERQGRQDAAVAAIEEDDFVRDIIDTFDATLMDASIKPIN